MVQGNNRTGRSLGGASSSRVGNGLGTGGGRAPNTGGLAGRNQILNLHSRANSVRGTITNRNALSHTPYGGGSSGSGSFRSNANTISSSRVSSGGGFPPAILGPVVPRSNNSSNPTGGNNNQNNNSSSSGNNSGGFTFGGPGSGFFGSGNTNNNPLNPLPQPETPEPEPETPTNPEPPTNNTPTQPAPDPVDPPPGDVVRVEGEGNAGRNILALLNNTLRLGGYDSLDDSYQYDYHGYLFDQGKGDVVRDHTFKYLIRFVANQLGDQGSGEIIRDDIRDHMQDAGYKFGGRGRNDIYETYTGRTGDILNRLQPVVENMEVNSYRELEELYKLFAKELGVELPETDAEFILSQGQDRAKYFSDFTDHLVSQNTDQLAAEEAGSNVHNHLLEKREVFEARVPFWNDAESFWNDLENRGVPSNNEAEFTRLARELFNLESLADVSEGITDGGHAEHASEISRLRSELLALYSASS